MPSSKVSHNSYVAPGMPPLEYEQGGRNTSYFEFWPMWLIYLPVVLQWLLLACRYRSLSLPLIANPAVPLSGMVGAAKSRVFSIAGEEARQWLLPWFVYSVTEEPIAQQCDRVQEIMRAHDIDFPVVGKPDIGCRGAGVKLLADDKALASYIEDFPLSGHIQFQQLSPWEAEAGVFYVRHPDQARGEITSLTLKYSPYIVGDGQSTVAELIAGDPRAGELQHLYAERHRANWQQVLAQGEAYRLVFSASHCRGAVFRDGQEYISTALRDQLDDIFADIPDFFYGRLDIKFRDLASLQAGEDFHIIEINGASSESINIWDNRASLGKAIATLLQQYRTLFKLGDANRRRGHKTPGLKALLEGWRREKELVKRYPLND